MKLILTPLLFLLFTSHQSAVAADLVDSISAAKENLSKTDETSRAVMGSLYDINLKMKRMSRRRDILNNRLIGVQGNVATLESSTKQLSDLIESQRRLLSARLRAMYMVGEEAPVRAIFSSSSSHELEKFLKYLKRFSNQDYRVIKSYEKNLSLLKRKKTALDVELSKLAQLRQKIKTQEVDLETNQKSKSVLLSQLESERSKTLKKIKGLRAKANRQGDVAALQTSFFEKKGELIWPSRATILQDYGLVEDAKYKYRLAHKGLTFDRHVESQVFSVHEGLVRHAGEVPGYGLTVVVDHFDHFYTVYSNLKNVLVKAGDEVKSGQIIASDSQKLYFEIRHFSDALDPEHWLQKKRIQQ